MKLNRKIFSIMLLLLLVVFLAGCLPGLFTPPPPKGVITGRVMVPSSEAAKDITGWVPAANATVTLTDPEGVTHTVTTDKDGYYTFTNIAVNTNTIITATATVNGNTVVLKGVIPQAVSETEDYDTGTMTPESTALALVVEKLIDEGISHEDIDLAEIQASETFTDLVEQVTTVIEEQGNVTEDPDVIDGVGNTTEEIINPTTPVTGVTLDQTTMTLTAGGATGTLAATVAPANATNKSVTWSSSVPAVATVVSGVVTPLTAGTTTITVTTVDGGKTATCAVTVNPAPVPVTGVTLDQTTMTLTAGGATGTLAATVAPANATDKSVTWSTSTPAVATVANGVVTPLTAGTTTITVTTVDGGKTATCAVTVNPPAPVTKTVTNTVTLSYAEGDSISASCSTTVTY